MKKLTLLMMIAIMQITLSCGRKETSAANSNVALTNANAVQTSEPLAAATVYLKPSEPCKWFEESLKLPAAEYKQSPTMPGMYYCIQVKPLVNQSNFEYHVVGDAEKIKYLDLSVRPGAQNSLEEDAKLQNMLTIAAQTALDKTSGQKFSEEILDAILMSETRDFTLDPGADKTKPQIKTVSLRKQLRDKRPWKYAKSITLKFE